MTIKLKKDELLKDDAIKKEYEKMRPEFEMATILIESRLQAKLTQVEVAQKMGTTQSVVARLESGHHLPSFKSLQKYAHAIEREIFITIHP
jgi:predicted transcriptional regulator